jgi:hypothetical protein
VRALPLLVIAGYLVAALPPCPEPDARGALRRGAGAEQAVHSLHGHGHDGAASAAAAEAPARGREVSVAAPCACGCKGRGAAAPAGRLGPALLPAAPACELARAGQPEPLEAASPPEAPVGLLDPVPRLA